MILNQIVSGQLMQIEWIIYCVIHILNDKQDTDLDLRTISVLEKIDDDSNWLLSIKDYSVEDYIMARYQMAKCTIIL